MVTEQEWAQLHKGAALYLGVMYIYPWKKLSIPDAMAH